MAPGPRGGRRAGRVACSARVGKATKPRRDRASGRLPPAPHFRRPHSRLSPSPGRVRSRSHAGRGMVGMTTSRRAGWWLLCVAVLVCYTWRPVIAWESARAPGRGHGAVRATQRGRTVPPHGWNGTAAWQLFSAHTKHASNRRWSSNNKQHVHTPLQKDKQTRSSICVWVSRLGKNALRLIDLNLITVYV